MKFLVDNQLPAALARFLSSHGHDARRVLDLKMDEASDSDIWQRAASEGRVVVSKDEDFLHLATRSSVLVAALEAGNRVVELR